jgi:hypothetical protein
MALDAVDKPLASGDLEKAAAALQAPPLVAFEDNACELPSRRRAVRKKTGFLGAARARAM